MSTPRRLAVGLLLPAAVALGSLAAIRPTALRPVAAETHRAADGSFAFTGHGYGHGHGMSQYGAYGAALKGLSTEQILAFYYPGTAAAAGGNPIIRVKLSTGPATVLNPSRDGDLTVADTAGAGRSMALPTSVTGAAVTGWRAVSAGSGVLALQGYWSASWQPYPTTASWTTTGALSFASSTGVIALQAADGSQRDYRGQIQGVPAGASVLALNLVPRESYLRSVVPSEMPSSWSAAALAAQAVAARTYEADVARPGNSYDICDNQACQVYSGMASYSAAGALQRTYEADSTDAAIAGTAGQLRTQDGAPILAQFASADGGWTAAGGASYLPAQADPYDGVVASTAHSWTQTVSAAAVGAAAGVGTATELVVNARDGHGDWGGRTTSVTVQGTTGSVTLAGTTFAGRLGLRSEWWTAPPGPAANTELTGRDLYAVLTHGNSGDVEVHGLAATGYSAFFLHAATGLGAVAVPADWRFLTTPYAGDGRADLYAIHLRGTASRRVEVHVLSAASGYRTFVAHIATALSALPSGQGYDLDLASYAGDGQPDLFFIPSTRTGSGRVEVHVLSAASHYGAFLLHAATGFSAVRPGEWTFLVGDGPGSGDLIGVHHGGRTGSGRSEAHVLTEASGYRTFSQHVATPAPLFAAGSTQWAWADYTGDGVGDLVFAVPASPSGHVDVHVLDGAGGYTGWAAHIATPLAASSPDTLRTSLG